MKLVSIPGEATESELSALDRTGDGGAPMLVTPGQDMPRDGRVWKGHEVPHAHCPHCRYFTVVRRADDHDLSESELSRIAQVRERIASRSGEART